MEFVLDTCYKGQRQYVNSSDLYLAIEAVVRERLDPLSWVISLNFRTLITSKCKLLLSELGSEPIVQGEAVCSVQTTDTIVKGVIVTTGESICKRVDFDEERIEETAVVKGSVISQRQRSGFTAIEEIVSLTKLLHNSTVPLANGKWIFSGIELNNPFLTESSSCFEVALVQNLAGRLTVSEIRQAGQLLGKIKFIVFL